MIGSFTGVDWTVVGGGVRGNFKAVAGVCEKRMEEAGGGLRNAEAERAVAGGSRANGLKATGLKADEDC
jgi:hypothetical protein